MFVNLLKKGGDRVVWKSGWRIIDRVGEKNDEMIFEKNEVLMNCGENSVVIIGCKL